MYVTASVDERKCTGCKICIYSCPDPNVIKLTVEKKVIIDGNRCKGCGLCAAACPANALAVKSI